MKINSIIRSGIRITKQYLPEIMLVVGVGGTIGSTVLACKKTLELPNVIDKHEDEANNISLIDAALNNEEDESLEENKKELKVLKRKYYLGMTKDIAQLYSVPAFIMGGSIALILGSHGMLRNRLATTAAAYMSLSASFEEYRNRVKETYGEAAERKISLGEKIDEIEEVTTDKKGNQVVKKKKIASINIPLDPHIWVFNEVTSDEWSENMNQNIMRLKFVQNRFNDLLNSADCFRKDIICVNDVADEFLNDKRVEWQVSAWIPGVSDSIDLGIFDAEGNFKEKECLKYVTYPSIIDPVTGNPKKFLSIVGSFNDEGTNGFAYWSNKKPPIGAIGEVLNEQVN